MMRETVSRRIPLCEPLLGGNEKSYLDECLATNFVSSVGPFVDRFERHFAEFVQAPHAVATCNGTAAIHTALRLVDAGPGDAVLVSTFTFIASVNPIRYLGADPVFIDSDATWNMDPSLLEEGIRAAQAAGKRVAAILAVHLYGEPADISPIVALAGRHGIPVIEDAAESLGAFVSGRSVGTFGRLGCFSFNGNKVITSGAGGMIVTADEAIARRAKHLTTQARVPGGEYFHDEVGFNYRLTNLQAAVGLAQLEQLPHFLDRKRQIAARYDEAFRGVDGLSRPATIHDGVSASWLYSIAVDPDTFGIDRRALAARLAGHRIEARPLWTPVHTFPPYAGSAAVLTGQADRLFAQGLSLPCSVSLTPHDQDYVIDAVLSARR